MDDILTGSSDFQEFQKLQIELISLFKKAGISLHKWCSNTPKILNSIPKEEQSWDFHCQSSDQTIKTLGIIWSPKFDYFSFKTAVNCHESYTKREILSVIARLFDPLGFLGPILTKAKLILQKLWVLKLEWDEPLSNPVAKEWNDFVSTLPVIQKEIEEAEEIWIKKVQAENFGIEINCLKENKILPKDSKIRELNPFLNERGIVRISGRLHQSTL
ncbi:integrase catalytic domain-containing protein [Trichonephila inaurata madagascariensis]|uniref:Integrase catalytic domain-containing protein n=1 Tax=Trichonephila inaurata madagascariensis TaxID=2747483 RepID=A0A8X6JTA9_9ARAC|nr:integrase catalytic domain-containing protein [Trichonephila inaurata madagascariensis]